jgi:capsular exopolysaccharide synthesis family protein
MSKIYEALRQAEADRTRNGPTQSNTATELAPEPVEMPSFSVTTRATAATPVRDTAAAPVPVLEPRNAAADAAIDLSQVPLVEWHPSLLRLPALDESGPAVEQFRSLRSRMQEFRDLNSLKAILVSSGLPREGKSFVAANLAVSLARHKSARVLLIDGDMRRATLHEMLGTGIAPGLTEYLSGSASIVEVMQRIRPDADGPKVPAGLTSLTFIPAGKEHAKAADLSGNRRFQQLITAVKPHFDWIVVDSSPVNLVSDGVNLARACDAVLLVARGGVTRFEVAQRATAELKASKILGFVLNAVENPPIAGGYYGYDGYDKIEA